MAGQGGWRYFTEEERTKQGWKVGALQANAGLPSPRWMCWCQGWKEFAEQKGINYIILCTVHFSLASGSDEGSYKRITVDPKGQGDTQQIKWQFKHN